MGSKRRVEVKSTITALPPGWYLPHLHLHEIILITLEVFSSLSDCVILHRLGKAPAAEHVHT